MTRESCTRVVQAPIKLKRFLDDIYLEYEANHPLRISDVRSCQRLASYQNIRSHTTWLVRALQAVLLPTSYKR